MMIKIKFTILFFLTLFVSCENNIKQNTKTEKVTNEVTLKGLKCITKLNDLLNSNTNNEINIDSISSLEQYFESKKKFNEDENILLRIDNLTIDINRRKRLSHGRLMFSSHTVGIWGFTIYKVNESHPISSEERTERNSSDLKKEIKHFYLNYKVDHPDVQKYEIKGPEFWISLDKEIEIHTLKAYLKASIEGYLEAIQELKSKPLCKLNKNEINLIKKELPYQIRLGIKAPKK